MKRYVCCLALLGVAVLPDWASAFHPCWSPPRYGAFGYGPGPIFPRRFAYVPPYAPVYEYPLPPPVVYPAVYVPQAYAPVAGPSAEPTRAAVPPTTYITPAAAPPSRVPADVDPMFRPAGGSPVPTVPPPAPPRKSDAPVPKSPPLTLPDVPVVPEPKGAAVPGAVPVPAPAPPGALDFGPLIPPTVPMLPMPDAKKAADTGGFPPLVLPPDDGGGPSGVVPSTSRSSPLAGGAKVQVFATDGAAAGPTRRVGFFNHTDRDISLVVAGKATTLPRKSYLHAEVPPTFQWKHGDRPTEVATVPAGAAGLDVLFRE